MQVIVKERSGKVVRGADGVHVTGEMQVELLHWNHLAVATACGATLDPEDGSEAWLSNGDGGSVANLVEPLCESDGGGRFPFTEWCWANCGDHDVLAACAGLL